MGFFTSLLSAAVPAIIGARSSRKAAERSAEAYATSIRTRVADSKAAGINPLYSLGASVQSPTFTSGSVMSDGMAVAKAASEALSKKSADKMSREQHEASLRESEARRERDFALASKYKSDIARAAQKSNAQQDKVIIGPFGTMRPGKQTPHDVREKQYGDVESIESGVNKLMDLVPSGRVKRTLKNMTKKQRIEWLRRERERHKKMKWWQHLRYWRN